MVEQGLFVGVLGPLLVRRGATELPGRHGAHRVVLNVLAAEPAQAVGTDELLQVVADLYPSRSWSRANIHTAVSRLRRSLPGAIIAERGAYALDSAVCAVDVAAFEEAVRLGRERIASGDGPRATSHLTDALGLWRGPALADWREHPRAAPVAARLEELRLGAAEDRATALLLANRLDEAVTACRDLLVVEPEREHAWALLVAAFERLGRGDEALRVVDEARRALASSGLEPGTELRLASQRLEGGQHDGTIATAGSTQGLHPLARLAARGCFVGRDVEMAALAEWGAPALAGGGARLVLIEGGAGVGKTRLAAELAAWAARRGAVVSFEVCDDSSDAPWARFVAWVRRMVLELDAVTRRRLCGGPLAAILHSDPMPATDASDPRRSVVFDAISSLVGEVAKGGLVLVVDDLHAAPGGSADLLRHLLVTCSDRSLLVVATLRHAAIGATREDPAAALRLLPSARSLLVGELDPKSAGSLVTELTGVPCLPGSEAAERLAVLAGGNPRLLTATAADEGLLETIRHGREVHSLRSSPAAAIVNTFLSGLAPAAVAVLEAAAVAGPAFDRRVVYYATAAVDEIDPFVVDETIARASADGWVRLDGEGRNRFRFAHKLVRRVVYDTTRAERRARVHLAVGRALSSLATGDDASEAAALHFSAAWPACSAAEAAHHLWRAGKQAARRSSLDRADAFFSAALDLLALESDDGSADLLRMELLVAAGRTRIDRGLVPEGLRLLRAALELPDAPRRKETVASAAVDYVGGARLAPPGGRPVIAPAIDAADRHHEVRSEALHLLHRVGSEPAERAR